MGETCELRPSVLSVEPESRRGPVADPGGGEEQLTARKKGAGLSLPEPDR
jgi:hypothetical protein